MSFEASWKIYFLLEKAIDVIGSTDYDYLEFENEAEQQFLENDIIDRLDELQERIDNFLGEQKKIEKKKTSFKKRYASKKLLEGIFG